MPIDRLQLVAQDTQFYRKNFRRLLRAVLVLGIISVLLLALIFFIQLNKSSVTYFVTTSDGRLIEIKPFE
jgi:hypothetical protein